ncbi:MAG: 3-hydroxyacyl-CoA dehydrogenase/enoyl-CoA hydratase family protein [Chloroflexota bacterium]
MSHGIESVTVIGAGTMGAAIAGHLANAGIPATLLDMVPSELTDQEQAAGLTLAHPKVRNRIVQGGFDRMVKAKPASLFSQDSLSRVTLGNLEDDFSDAISKSDWIVEAIIERPGPKQALMARIEKEAKTDAIITSNSSGIPMAIISEGRSDDFKKRFFGTHFFNPPRYLRLLEIIPTPESDPAMLDRMKQFGESRLGKGVVICKDTPNFVANRMISFIQSDLFEYVLANDYTVEEVDALTGPLIGRPKTGSFRLNDVIGIDIMALVGDNLYGMIPDDPDRVILKGESSSTLMNLMVKENLLGNKTGQGFYKTVRGEGGKKSFHGLKLRHAVETGEIDYLAPQKPRWESVGAARNLPLPQRLKAMVNADDRAAGLIRHSLLYTMAYASKRIPEITDTLVDLDNAMRWGFAWEMGIFEMWDALGVADALELMSKEGLTTAPWVQEMVEDGNDSFYSFSDSGAKLAYSVADKKHLPVDQSELVLSVNDVKRNGNTLAENDGASLVDMGDGVMLMEYHTKGNALDPDVWQIFGTALNRLHGDATGLVIGNDGPYFSAGANLMLFAMAVQSEAWDQIEAFLKTGQDMLQNLRKAPKPVVAAPHQMVLAGGAETMMGVDRIVAHAETYIGLVEFGVGIIPGWGGCKELVRRKVSPHMHAANVNPSPYLQEIFELIGYAKVSTSAKEAQSWEYLAPTDRIVMNRDHLLAEAKQEVLHMADGYTPPSAKANVYAAGAGQLANMRVGIYMLQTGGYISEHDAKIADKLAHVLCGGELSQGTWMDEQYFLDLEREAILSLIGEPKSLERIQYMLMNNKALRN